MEALEYQYIALKLFQKDPELTQRQLAIKLGISLGKANYIVRALTGEGCIKIDHIRKSNKKTGYAYLLTQKGIREKTDLAKRFFIFKKNQYERLQSEIRALKHEMEKEGKTTLKRKQKKDT